MKQALNIFSSPELYPTRLDFQRRIVNFVRMSRDNYRDTVFLDTRVKHLGEGTYSVRLDDLLFAVAGAPRPAAPSHYILHTTFCCSTLLARYFELLHSCLVLKEPGVLTQLALTRSLPAVEWDEAFDLCIRLLARTYKPDELVVIKAHEPCNILANKILQNDDRTRIIFVMTSLRHFILAILKSEFRRNWVRKRIPTAGNAAGCPVLLDIDPLGLSDAQAAAYLWLVNRFLCGRLAGGHPSRVLVLDGGRLADSPESALRAAVNLLGFPEAERTQLLAARPSAAKYSKDVSKPYDAISRRTEIADLEVRFGREADAATEWASSHQIGYDLDNYRCG